MQKASLLHIREVSERRNVGKQFPYSFLVQEHNGCVRGLSFEELVKTFASGVIVKEDDTCDSDIAEADTRALHNVAAFYCGLAAGARSAECLIADVSRETGLVLNSKDGGISE